MKTSITKIILFLAVITFFASCSDDTVPPLASEVTERVDMLLSGDEDIYIYEQSIEAETGNDLVKFDLSNLNNSTFGYEIKISESTVLKIKMYDSESNEPYARVGVSYSQYAKQDLNDKSRYVTIEMIDMTASETVVYTSNIISNDQANIDVFSVQKYDFWEKEMLCRISNIKMYNANNYDDVLTITGTFRGGYHFLLKYKYFQQGWSPI